MPERPEFARPTAPADPIATCALRKATWRLIPLIALGYGTAYMDRVNVSFASLQMNRDLHFSNTVYGLGAGLFFLSYSACEIPSNLLLYRFGARRWLARIMVTWGLIAIAMVFVRTARQFYAARFFLGMAEAGFFPGVIFYLTQWFPIEMRARTIARFYISFPLSSVLMGIVAGALLNLQGHLSLAGWQWLFLVEAVPAIVLGALFFLYLPDGPADAPWLTEPERHSILGNLQRNPTGQAASHAIGPAFRDRRVWLLGTFMFFMLSSGYSYQFYAPAIVQKITGFTTTKVGFVVAAMNLLGAIAMLVNGSLADRSEQRALHKNVTIFRYVIPGCLFTAAGFLVLGLSSTAPAALAGLLLIMVAYISLQGTLWSIATSFLTGRSAAAGIAAMNTIGIMGGFIGPYWMGFARDLTGDYQRGLLTMTAAMLAAAGIMSYLRHQAALAAQYKSSPNPVASLP